MTITILPIGCQNAQILTVHRFDSEARAFSTQELLDSLWGLEVFKVYSYSPLEALARLRSGVRACFDEASLEEHTLVWDTPRSWNCVLNIVRFLNVRREAQGASVWNQVPEMVVRSLAEADSG